MVELWEGKKRDLLSPEHILDCGKYPEEEVNHGSRNQKRKKNATLPYHPCPLTSAEAPPLYAQTPRSEVTGSCDFDLC